MDTAEVIKESYNGTAWSFDKGHGGCYSPCGNNDDGNYNKHLSTIKFKPKPQFKGKLREKLLQIIWKDL